jgi:hypothetical protein
MARGVAVDPPRNGFTVGRCTGGPVLAFEDATRGDDSLVSHVEVLDQDVEMDQPRAACCRRSVRGIRAGLEGEPLAVGWRFQRHPARIPLDGCAAEQTSPELGQRRRLRAVEHDLADPADRHLLGIGHFSIVTLPEAARATRGRPAPSWTRQRSMGASASTSSAPARSGSATKTVLTPCSASTRWRSRCCCGVPAWWRWA